MPVFDSESIQRQRLGAVKESRSEQRTRQLRANVANNEATVADDCGRPTDSLEAQIGKPLSGEEVRRRLLACNPRLVFERSINYPELTGIYIRIADKLVHVCGMETAWMPEFTVKHRKKIRVPDEDIFGTKKMVDSVQWKEISTVADITRGWRAVLDMLLEAKLITYGDVDRLFGMRPSMPSQNWMPNER